MRSHARHWIGAALALALVAAAPAARSAADAAAAPVRNAGGAATARIKDVATVQGVRSNQLVG
ncbi:MAG: flagellar basal body P-ring protein FlgI, partial [Pseudomonadota bacterium]